VFGLLQIKSAVWLRMTKFRVYGDGVHCSRSLKSS